jgi:opacity protein-like surface antigen
MLKKTLLSTAILALTSSIAFAGAMGPVQPCEKYIYEAGPYVGFSVGPRIMQTGNPLQYIGVEGNLSAGYGHLWNQWFYLAGEVFGGNSVRIKNFGIENIPGRFAVSNVRSTWSYGFDAIPGIMINEKTLGYLRGGVVNTTFQIASDFQSQESHSTGWRAGVGLQTNVYKNLDVRMEYVYNQFYRQTEPMRWGRPIMNMVNLGVTYRFV